MKYEIFINGGFANIPKQYKGEIILPNREKKKLLEILSQKQEPSQEIHDGFIYHVKIIDGNSEVKSVYDEHNLPLSVSDFINKALSKKGK
ncbi:hypothetical protein [Maribacter sp. 2308TA10-17]|uniref:hypothetical protein n=1 Tax=Maribacter sp. 2308TA10-17 TaxID=3386276 RepID=UPI0039BCB914